MPKAHWYPVDNASSSYPSPCALPATCRCLPAPAPASIPARASCRPGQSRGQTRPRQASPYPVPWPSIPNNKKHTGSSETACLTAATNPAVRHHRANRRARGTPAPPSADHHPVPAKPAYAPVLHYCAHRRAVPAATLIVPHHPWEKRRAKRGQSFLRGQNPAYPRRDQTHIPAHHIRRFAPPHRPSYPVLLRTCRHDPQNAPSLHHKAIAKTVTTPAAPAFAQAQPWPARTKTAAHRTKQKTNNYGVATYPPSAERESAIA